MLYIWNRKAMWSKGEIGMLKGLFSRKSSMMCLFSGFQGEERAVLPSLRWPFGFVMLRLSIPAFVWLAQ